MFTALNLEKIVGRPNFQVLNRLPSTNIALKKNRENIVGRRPDSRSFHRSDALFWPPSIFSMLLGPIEIQHSLRDSLLWTRGVCII